MKLKSVTALTAIVILCIVLAVALAVCAPWIVHWYAQFRAIDPPGERAILISYLVSTVPALVALAAMLRLLLRIRHTRPFDPTNPALLSVISWCCLAVAAICAVGGVWYLPLYMVTISMLFLFLAVRVVCSCFKAAAVLQEDNDLTV